MALPVVKVILPAVLAGQANGRLPDSILVDTPGQAGGPTVRLVAPAARAWRALCAAALAAGHVLKTSGLYDSYRPGEIQVKLFFQRFTTTYIAGATTRTYQGTKYYLKPGYALAAVPYTSNHGLGLAVDCGVELDGDTGTESLDNATLAWLLAGNAQAHGWSWEAQSEDWHIRYVAGDNIPAAVLAYEAGHPFTAGGNMWELTQYGAKGDDVGDLQEVLADMGYDVTVDRVYGDQTAAAVKAAVAPWVGGDPTGRTYWRGERFHLFRAYVRHLAGGEPAPADPAAIAAAVAAGLAKVKATTALFVED